MPPDVSEALIDLLAEMLVREYEHHHEAGSELATTTVAALRGNDREPTEAVDP
jgi:hypothetical protein